MSDSQHTPEHSTLTQIVVASITFLISLPLMWFIGQFAVFFLGLGIWIVPYLFGALFGGALFPQGSFSFIATEFDGPIIGFAFFAALQNAALAFWYLHSIGRSKRYDLLLTLLVGLTILGSAAGLLLMLAL